MNESAQKKKNKHHEHETPIESKKRPHYCTAAIAMCHHLHRLPVHVNAVAYVVDSLGECLRARFKSALVSTSKQPRVWFECCQLS